MSYSSVVASIIRYIASRVTRASWTCTETGIVLNGRFQYLIQWPENSNIDSSYTGLWRELPGVALAER